MAASAQQVSHVGSGPGMRGDGLLLVGVHAKPQPLRQRRQRGRDAQWLLRWPPPARVVVGVPVGVLQCQLALSDPAHARQRLHATPSRRGLRTRWLADHRRHRPRPAGGAPACPVAPWRPVKMGLRGGRFDTRPGAGTSRPAAAAAGGASRMLAICSAVCPCPPTIQVASRPAVGPAPPVTDPSRPPTAPPAAVTLVVVPLSVLACRRTCHTASPAAAPLVRARPTSPSAGRAATSRATGRWRPATPRSRPRSPSGWRVPPAPRLPPDHARAFFPGRWGRRRSTASTQP